MKNATVAAQTGAGVPTKLQVFKQIAPSANIPGVSTPAGQALTNTTSYLQHLASQTGSQGKPVLTLQQRMQKVDTAYGAGQQKAAAADAAAAKTAPAPFPAPAPAGYQGAAGVATAAGAGAVPDWILKSQAQNAAAKAANDALRAKQVAENNAVKQNYLQQQAQRQAARKAPAPAAAPATAPVAQAPAPAFAPAPAGAPTAKQQQAVSKATTVKQLTQGGTVQQAGANLAAKPGATPAPAIPTVATVSPALR
jgi:hypothetical protein